jgi:hypothetical protein
VAVYGRFPAREAFGRIIEWQNPGEVAGLLLQAFGSQVRFRTKQFLAILRGAISLG